MSEHAKRSGAALALAAAWVLVTLFVLAELLPAPGLVTASALPLLARVFVWGVLAPILSYRVNLAPALAGAIGLEAIACGWASPARSALALAVGFVPAQFFYRWTRDRAHLRARVFLHFVYYTLLLLWVVPAVILGLSGGSFAPLSELSWMDEMLLQTLVVPAVLAVAATLEFRDRGRGTPMPFDAPSRLVTTGPYAYVANPLQIAKVLLVLGWGFFLDSPWVMAAAGAVFVYGATIARASEDRRLSRRFGKSWTEYRRGVPRWWPRWRPWRHPGDPPGRLYYDGDCRQCRQLAWWFSSASHLELHPADDLERLAYEPGIGGPTETGIRALARGLEHVHLGWAFIGWSLRVPILVSLFQLIADAVTAPSSAGSCSLGTDAARASAVRGKLSATRLAS